MKEIIINGFTYYVDVINRILYEDREKTKGVPFNYLPKNELELIERKLRFSNNKQ